MSVNPFLEARRGIGINNATLRASSCRCDSNCNAAVASPHPFDNTIASNTCRYCSQLVDPLNQGTFVVVSAACRTRGTCTGALGVLRNRFSVCRSSRSCCIRDTVFSNAATGDHSSVCRFRPAVSVRCSARPPGANTVPSVIVRGPRGW